MNHFRADRLMKLMMLRKAAKEENHGAEKIKTETVKEPLTFRGLI